MDIWVDRLLDSQNLAVPGYFITSTAPVNVEDDAEYVEDTTRPTIHDVIECLYSASKTSNDSVGLVIAIHGYNSGVEDNGFDGIREFWYKPLCEYVNQDSYIKGKLDRGVFLGYRWPSERISNQVITTALTALPFLLSIVLYGGLLLTVVWLVLLLWKASFIFAILIVLSVVLFSIVFSLVGLRAIVYFRDEYRARTFGVPDLVELIRQLDQGLLDRRIQDTLTTEALSEKIISKISELQSLDRGIVSEEIKRIRAEVRKQQDLLIDPESSKFQLFLTKLKRQSLLPNLDSGTLTQIVERLVLIEALEYDNAQRYWQQKLIKLSFIGHSMGAYVTTQVIRILSDVFDSRSVGSIGDDQINKLPSSRIGRVFSLGRLVLTAPDIPLLAITSGRTNFLRSSLRRFEEAYLFSNEGDLALRIASTAANYFSFPAKSRTQGYRLGNVTVRPQVNQLSRSRSGSEVYGIVNLGSLPSLPTDHLLKYLEVSVLNKNETQSLDPIIQKRQDAEESVTSNREDKESIADLFTYFDCTEYQDFTDYNSQGQTNIHTVLIKDKQRSPLSLIEYAKLFFAFVTFTPQKFPQGRDTHGGYFAGKFSKLLIYRLAFVGFQGLLDSLVVEPPETFGTQLLPPSDLSAEIDRVRSMGDADMPPPQHLIRQREKRQAALRYLSWLCEQKRIQVVASPERYQVDVLGRDRDDIREAILLQEDK